EAIHLHNNPSNCQLPLEINKARGIEELGKAVEDVVGWLFWGKHTAGGLEVSSWDDKGVSRALTAWLVDAVTSRERFPEYEKRLGQTFRSDLVDANLPRLILKYEQMNEPERVSIGVFAGMGLSSMSARIPEGAASIFLPSGPPPAEQDVAFFGELEGSKRQEEILPALQILEPQLSRLSLVPLSGQSVIHGDVGLPRLVPVPFLGEGLRRLLSFTMAIVKASGGVVLIDEIENGLHYSVMKDVWQAIAKAARDADVQVFATTHSWECIRAAHHAFKASDTYDFRYHRLDRRGDEILVRTFSEKMLDAVEQSDLEVR
ncbi:MAG: ATP-binding protein, partial [Acidobacteria bacterium]|nr:ATP-binding protein [Acidobacteriota bacterium]